MKPLMYYDVFQMVLALLLLATRVSSQCNGKAINLTATGLPQYFETPNYPSDYRKDEECLYLVTSNNSASIVFNVEDIELDSCSDYLAVYDGSDNQGTDLGQHCLPGTILLTSSGTHLYLEFIADRNDRARGISALYLTPDDALKPACNTTLNPATSHTQYFMSQNLPDAYSTNLNCWYKIYPTTEHSGISFEVIFMDIENTGNCTSDRLSISSVYGQTVEEVMSGCAGAGEYKTTFTTAFESVGDFGFVQFTTDGNDTDQKGFYLSYTEVSRGILMTYPSANATLHLTATESLTGVINDTIGYVALNLSGSLDYGDVDGVQYFTLTEDSSISGRYTVDLINAVDYETRQEVTSLLSMSPSEDPYIRLFVMINVTIIDEDDNAPVFLNLPENITLDRTQVAGTAVYTVRANDSDLSPEYNNVSYYISSAEDPNGLLNLVWTGEITLAIDIATMPTTVTEYTVGITALSAVGNLETIGYLTIIMPPDQPPSCSHVEIYAEPLENNFHEAFMDIEFDEPWTCTDEFDITYSIGAVSPSLSNTLFDIDEHYGDLWIIRKYTEDELDLTLIFEVEVIATDTGSQTTSFLVIVNTTDFGCHPNPQTLNARMGDPPGTVLKNDFNCTDQTGLSFSIKKQYPSNAFQMVTYPDGTYAVTLQEQVYKIKFYSLVVRVSNGNAGINLIFRVIVQTNICTVEDVNTLG